MFKKIFLSLTVVIFISGMINLSFAMTCGDQEHKGHTQLAQANAGDTAREAVKDTASEGVVNAGSKIKEIKLEARQYRFSPDPVVVKKGDIVRLKVTSGDVTHGMYIKEYGINLSVKKGEVKEIEFLADKPGKFDIICSVYCGTGHSGMRSTLIVEEK